MNRELFGVFGAIDTFNRFRSNDAFDEVVTGPSLTVGVRDPDLGEPGWSALCATDDGFCLIWGEIFVPDDDTNAARWLLERYPEHGRDALSQLNGSYVAVLDSASADEAFVATDPVRSRACFYTDESGPRRFGTDASQIAQTVDDPTLDRNGILEFLHLGVTLGEKSALEEVKRLPIDGCLRSKTVEDLERFVYDPREFDYVDELAQRLERALRRRRVLPGKKGILLSAGYDSRVILSRIPDIERSYTVGAPAAQEVQGAKRLSEQYDVTHTAFEPDERYLRADESKIRYGQGIKESLHIHHAGYTDEFDVDTVYHGLLCDTFFRGHFNAEQLVDVLGKRIPTGHIETDPEPAEVLLRKFGYTRDASLDLTDRTDFNVDPRSFVRETLTEQLEEKETRAKTIQNRLNCVGIANQPSVPFHDHLSDHFLTSFLAIDRELIEWHLQTPPAHRTTETFLAACTQLDDDILAHRPPDRPHDTMLLNEIERFVRRKTPLLASFQPPWPDRQTLFERHDYDQRLLADVEHVHDLPARHKLRLIDLRTWLGYWRNSGDQSLPWLENSN